MPKLTYLEINYNAGMQHEDASQQMNDQPCQVHHLETWKALITEALFLGLRGAGQGEMFSMDSCCLTI